MLSAVEAEVAAEPEALSALADARVRASPVGSLFVGSGDSLAAARIADRLSGFRQLVANPYDLMVSPQISKGRAVYFISVSGRTKSNVAAAKAVRGHALKTIAVTADPQSALARASGGLIALPYETKPRTPGFLSFGLTLLTLCWLADVSLRCDFSGLLALARRRSDEIQFSEDGTTYFLGNGPAYPAASYASLKASEVLGAAAHGDVLEDFAHARLFGLKVRDAVNVIDAFDPNALGARLVRRLNRNGFASSSVALFGSNALEQVFSFIFLAQMAVVRRASSLGLRHAYFTRVPRLLSVSDSLIY